MPGVAAAAAAHAMSSMTNMATATAVTGAAAEGAFAYNRANFFWDQGKRFARYTTGYSMAIAQTSMYREDLRDLTDFVVTKATMYHTIGTICFVLNFQLIMAGRLGVHGPSPPSWLLGLYWTNICTALSFLIIFTWLSMHSGARATAGCAHMLTRTVRLPIPSPNMLDKARLTGNAFEKQRVVDVFRVPFVAPAQRETEEDPEVGARVPLSDRRMPKWYHDETKDLRKDEGGPAAGSNPQHFELYRGLQDEWWSHDVYARIGITYFFSNWLTAASLYSQCHIFTELRCIWPAWTVTALFVAAHYGVLNLDIADRPREGGIGLPVEKIAPIVPFLAVLGMTLDYSVITPSVFWQGFIFLLSWFGYAISFFWALRMYDLAAPRTRRTELEEVPGQHWWPIEWPVPPAFENTVYVVAAPKQLEPGNTCLTQEMNAAKGERSQSVPVKKGKGLHSTNLPWKVFRGVLITVIGCWVLIMFGRGFEHANGERHLVKAEGRVERWPSHIQPWLAPWTRLNSRNEMCHAGGCDRRLQESPNHVSSLAKRLVSTIGPLMQAMERTANSRVPAVEEFPAISEQMPFSWPNGFQPSLLVSRGDGSEVLGLDRKSLSGNMISTSGAPGSDMQVALKGIENLGELLGAFWDNSGLLLTTKSGKLGECSEGGRAGNEWNCREVESHRAPPLPAGLASAVFGRTASGIFKAAVTHHGDSSVVLLDPDHESASWLPAGEMDVDEPATFSTRSIVEKVLASALASS